MVVLLVLGFRESGRLASAYGIAVTGTMLITTLMLGVLVFLVWRWNRIVATITIGTFLAVDGTFFASNIAKIPDGGWFPLLVAAISFTVLTTWAKGRQLMRARLEESALPLSVFIKSAAASVHRVRGTSVFLSATAESVPAALLHNLKHNQVLHERVIILNVEVVRTPRQDPVRRVEIEETLPGGYLIRARFGFMETPDVGEALKSCRVRGLRVFAEDSSFFVGQHVVRARPLPGWKGLQRRLFAWMQRHSTQAAEFFRMPFRGVIVLNTVVEI